MLKLLTTPNMVLELQLTRFVIQLHISIMYVWMLGAYIEYFKINTQTSHYEGDVPYHFPLLTLGVAALIPFFPLAVLVLLDVAATVRCHHYLNWFTRLYSSIGKQMHTALGNCCLHCLIHQPAVCAYRKCRCSISKAPQPANFVSKKHFIFQEVPNEAITCLR